MKASEFFQLGAAPLGQTKHQGGAMSVELVEQAFSEILKREESFTGPVTLADKSPKEPLALRDTSPERRQPVDEPKREEFDAGSEPARSDKPREREISSEDYVAPEEREQPAASNSEKPAQPNDVARAEDDTSIETPEKPHQGAEENADKPQTAGAEELPDDGDGESRDVPGHNVTAELAEVLPGNENAVAPVVLASLDPNKKVADGTPVVDVDAIGKLPAQGVEAPVDGELNGGLLPGTNVQGETQAAPLQAGAQPKNEAGPTNVAGPSVTSPTATPVNPGVVTGSAAAAVAAPTIEGAVVPSTEAGTVDAAAVIAEDVAPEVLAGKAVEKPTAQSQQVALNGTPKTATGGQELGSDLGFGEVEELAASKRPAIGTVVNEAEGKGLANSGQRNPEGSQASQAQLAAQQQQVNSGARPTAAPAITRGDGGISQVSLTSGGTDTSTTGGQTIGSADQARALTTQLRPAGTAGPSAPQPSVPMSALSAHITRQHANGNNKFQIRLDPAELGRVDVKMEVTRDGVVTTHLVVERPETLDMLQRDARALERALGQSGLETKDGGLTFSLQDQNPESGQFGDGSSSEEGLGGSGSTTDDVDADLLNTAIEQSYVATSGVDIRI